MDNQVSATRPWPSRPEVSSEGNYGMATAFQEDTFLPALGTTTIPAGLHLPGQTTDRRIDSG